MHNGVALLTIVWYNYVCYNYLRTETKGDSAMFKRIYNFIKETNEKRVAFWQLNNMSDKALKDMGISRGEIYSKIYGKCSG